VEGLCKRHPSDRGKVIGHDRTAAAAEGGRKTGANVALGGGDDRDWARR
jgi:hypothetical protein